MILYVAYYSAAKFKLPIKQPSTAKCGSGGHGNWKLNRILVAVAS